MLQTIFSDIAWAFGFGEGELLLQLIWKTFGTLCSQVFAESLKRGFQTGPPQKK